jgi:hypothetical protein
VFGILGWGIPLCVGFSIAQLGFDALFKPIHLRDILAATAGAIGGGLIGGIVYGGLSWFALAWLFAKSKKKKDAAE